MPELKDVAEAMLSASEDPIAGIDQKEEVFMTKLWQEFINRDPAPMSAKTYRDRRIKAVFEKSKAISKDIMVFHKAQMFVLACQPTGGLSDDEIFSLAVARHTGAMASRLDYTHKDTPHTDWLYTDDYKVLRCSPKWQGASLGSGGAVSDIRGDRHDFSTDAAKAAVESDGVSAAPVGRKRAKRTQAEALAVSNAMLSVAKSMAASAESVGKNAAAQSERNGIMLFIGKYDVEDESAQEFFRLRKKLHLSNARAEAAAAAAAAAATTAAITASLLHVVEPAGADNSPVDGEEEDGLDSL